MKTVLSKLMIGLLFVAGCGINHATSVPDINVTAVAKSEVLHAKAKTEPHVTNNVATISELGEVNDDSVALAIDQIERANRYHVKKIVLPINSPGGSVPAGWELIKVIEASKIPVICVVEDGGMAASMGYAILQSCHERVMSRRAVLMAHQIRLGGMFSGQPGDWENVVKMMRALEAALDWQCSHRMKISLEEYKKRVDNGREYWLGADDALYDGAVDRLVDRSDQI
jgi:ATP-dependent protease ClpP protease subunit